MSYLAVKDLKKTRYLREKLAEERELILTKDGQPFAVLIGISPDNLETSLNEIRRARFSAAVRRARQKGAASPPHSGMIEDEIRASRNDRG
jgi:hypothetical protein